MRLQQGLEDFAVSEFPFGIEEPPIDWMAWLPWLGGIVLILLLLPRVVRGLQRGAQSQPEAEVEVAPQPNPRQRMQTRLLALQQLPLHDAEHCSQFFEQAAAALRLYLIEQWRFPADRQTSEEPLLSWRQTDLDEQDLRLLLQLCDGSKFAQRQAVAADVESWLTQCRKFVEVGA